ncbi:hypothetical protein MPSEU_000095500 [Mayamaea pseudoterrestris]|nr:hypothetical protein MPSEU_000095500 [Mayamaea pseudoterrestris]
MAEEGTTTVTSVTRTHAEDVLYAEEYQPCFLWTLILAPCFMPFVWKYHVRVTTTELQFGYSVECAQMRIDRSTIESVEAIENISACCDWGGYGIRIQLPSMEKGYLPKSGSGVRVTFTKDGKELAYTFICNDADKVAGMLSPVIK